MYIFLDVLSDDELQYFVRENLSDFLIPFKTNNKNYIKYSSQLGNKRKDSPLVQRNLPRIAVELYHKHDRNFVKAMERIADTYANQFMNCVNEMFEIKLDEIDIKELTDEKIVDILNGYKDGDGHVIDLELLWIQLKLMGVEHVDERKENISRLYGVDIEAEEDAEIENDECTENEIDKSDSDAIDEVAEKNTDTVKKPRIKKLTAEEKAAKNKAALEAKKRANQDKVEQKEEVIQNKNNLDEEMASTGSPGVDKELEASLDMDEEEEEKKVAQYIGVIAIRTNFFNFFPIGEYLDGEFYAFTEKEVDDLLPKSLKRNINLYYQHWDDSQKRLMEKYFQDGELVLLKCEIEELEENLTPAGDLNQTGYKINGIESWKRGIISPLSNGGLFKLIPKSALLDEIETRRAIRVDSEGLIEGEDVLVNFGDGFYGGPFKIGYSEQNDTFFINLLAAGGRNCISGYKTSDIYTINIEPSNDAKNWVGNHRWSYYAVKKNASTIVKDYLSDEDLLISFKESLKQAEELDYNNLDVNGIIEEVGESQIVGKNIPDDIKEQRIERIRKILSSKEDLTKLYAESSEIICDLLLKNHESEQFKTLLSDVLDNKPEILDKLQGIRVIQSKVDSKRAELEQLEAQVAEAEARSKQARDDKNTEGKQIIQLEAELDAKITEKKAEYDAILDRLELADSVDHLQTKSTNLQKEVSYYEQHKARLMNDAKNLESNFVELINGYSEKMADITFDGFMSSKMLQAASEWEGNRDAEKLDKIVSGINNVQKEEMSETEVLEYLINAVNVSRPGYSRNTIINILICTSQGFLTVFAGEPGCGKTSICNIVSRVLGLHNYENIAAEFKDVRRYIPVSVERGWTSKRDFIGYFNPLTKAFEESNRDVFEGLKILDKEQRKGYKKWPFIILLDEANLSLMEYYWADFMNVCDDLSEDSSINLGNDNVFHIPETLRFLATINNDHTTETLSPRLIDRAWVIMLPRNTSVQINQAIQTEQIKNVTWNELKRVFTASETDTKTFDREIRAIYDVVLEKLSKQGLYVSPRVDIAIQKYCVVAARLMEDDEFGNSSNVVALDYAIAQKILPKIIGSGDEYEAWLEDLQTFCNNKGLVYSARIIRNIIRRGSINMKYYQFF